GRADRLRGRRGERARGGARDERRERERREQPAGVHLLVPCSATRVGVPPPSSAYRLSGSACDRLQYCWKRFAAAAVSSPYHRSRMARLYQGAARLGSSSIARWNSFSAASASPARSSAMP